MQNFGSSFYKVSGLVFFTEEEAKLAVERMRWEFDYGMDAECDLLIRLYWQGKPYDLGSLPPQTPSPQPRPPRRSRCGGQ